MAKKKLTRKNWVSSHKLLTGLLVVIALFLLMLVSFVVTWIPVQNNQQRILANDIIARHIIRAVESLKKDVPADPETGDLYFPEAKLYLPNPRENTSYTYAVNSEDEPEGVSVSWKNLPTIKGFYNTPDTEQMFEAVPKLQSCSRGVYLAYEQFAASEDRQLSLKQTVVLENGRELYIYTEALCPELNETADMLKNVRSY